MAVRLFNYQGVFKVCRLSGSISGQRFASVAWLDAEPGARRQVVAAIPGTCLPVRELPGCGLPPHTPAPSHDQGDGSPPWPTPSRSALLLPQLIAEILGSLLLGHLLTVVSWQSPGLMSAWRPLTLAH